MPLPFRVLQAATKIDPPQPVDDGCLDYKGSIFVPAWEVDVLCRQTWVARSFHAMVPMDGVFYLLGGYESNNYYANDLWYRDDRNPSTVIAIAPRDQTNDNFFVFACDEPFCIFEYR